MTLITADYELGGGTMKRQQLSSRLVKLTEEDRTTEERIRVVTALVNGNDEPINETIGDGVPPNEGVSNEEMLAILCSSDEEPEPKRIVETVEPPAVALLPEAPEHV